MASSLALEVSGQSGGVKGVREGGGMVAGERTNRQRFGQEAEEAAVQHLIRNGYAVLARNFFCRYGELDIVAEKDELICFVEVRMRSSAAWGDPSHTIT